MASLTRRVINAQQPPDLAGHYTRASRLVAMAADCKSALFGDRWFESSLAHQLLITGRTSNAVLVVGTTRFLRPSYTTVEFLPY